MARTRKQFNIGPADLLPGERKIIEVDGKSIGLFNVNGEFFAMHNRCPHMGFPLHKGSVKDCILTCHWHHARFDLTSGGTFDMWADDGRAYEGIVCSSAMKAS